ncbi:MAG TPA: methylated-DNA--[protein]-cysteine S-methyltransferase [Candidatus Sulfotelmatobacter sp.]
MQVFHSATVDSPVGPLFLAVSEVGIVALEFGFKPARRGSLRCELNQAEEEGKLNRRMDPDGLRPYVTEIEQYFAGHRRVFNFPLDLRGTGFQLACWNTLLAIPYGETRTYADVARAIGKPNASRAVGMANNRNPIAIVVPCHRVIASDGTLCGYGGGLDVKRNLLQLEGALSACLAG